jgi:signal transduction histidine kinase
MLTQVLFNLIDNAVAFSPDGARIVVSTQRTDADQLEFVVMDHGKGIPADMIDRVFQRFEARSQGADRRGAGLGLSIVRAFVELHGGRVRIVSAEGQGTQVACAFPNADTVRRMGQSLRQRRPRSEAAE